MKRNKGSTKQQAPFNGGDVWEKKSIYIIPKLK